MTPEKAKELKAKVQAQYRDGWVDVFNALIDELTDKPVPQAETQSSLMGAEHDPKPETVTLTRETAVTLYMMVSARTWCNPESNMAFNKLRAALDRK